MITPSERIHDLVQKGALPAEQGETLLDALKQEPSRKSRLWLDPLERFGGERLALVGAALVLLGAALRPFGVAFDGFLDTHFVEGPPRWAHVLAEAAVAWPLGALLLWGISLVVARQGRFIDFLGLVGVARVPVLLVGVVLAIVAPLSPPGFSPDHPPELTGRLLAMVVVGCVMLPWQIVLLYRGFGTASGLRGARQIVAFMVGLLLAELGSKMVLSISMKG
jgi:hypothetical protein